METTKHKMPEKAEEFFKGLSQILETKMLFFGSIQRNDYFPGDSDIDVDLFVDNVHSTMAKMQTYLHLEKRKFKKFVWKLYNGRVAYGYKVAYKKPEEKFRVEFSIYDEKFKEDVLFEHKLKMILPFYVSWMLIVLKFVYYKLEWIDRDTFKRLKGNLLGAMIGMPEDVFIVLDENPDATTTQIYNVVNNGYNVKP